MAVLWCLTLLSALAMAASTTFRGFAGVMAIDRDRVQAEALLTAGVETAAGLLGQLKGTPLKGFDDTVVLSAGSVHMTLSDEGGRIDIGRAPVELLTGLFRSIGASERQASAVAQQFVEWRKQLVRSAGQNWPFTNNRQLSLAPGMPPEWVDALEPLTTVYGSETVNPLTAPAGVIAALPGIDQARLQAFLETRANFPTDFVQLQAILSPARRYFAVKPQNVISIQLAARLPDGYRATARTVIVVLADDSQPYRVLEWNPLASARDARP